MSVGAGLTMVVVHQDAQLQFVRTIDLGGATITAAIASALDLPMSDSEEIKRQLGNESTNDSRAVSATDEVVTELVDEIQSSIRFFSSLPGRNTPERILVTGAGAQVAGFMDALRMASAFRYSLPHRCPSSTPAICRSRRSKRRPSTRPWPCRSGSRCQTRRVSSSTSCLPRWSKTASAGTSYECWASAAWRWSSCWLPAPGGDFSSPVEQEQGVALQTQVTFINKVEIPKYDKVVALANQVRPCRQSSSRWSPAKSIGSLS